MKKVFAGISGGVDSSVSAALLKRKGFEVIGVFIKVWEPAGFVCTWREERREARRVAAHLDILLITLDLSREYKKKVVDYFIAEYKAGRTPNPDVMCNKYIKFGVFYNWAMTHRADFVATGHYAQIIKNKLGVSEDKNKDQTYFLWNLKQEQLAKILFPVGSYTKTQVRGLAKKFGLPNAEKKDSQGLCFIGQIDFKNFLKRELAEKRGSVLNEQGKIIGQHAGATFFTLGERHGFDVFVKTPDEKPYYVIAKDIKKNTITVSPKSHRGLPSVIREVKIEKTNWLTPISLEDSPLGAVQGLSSGSFLARVRYRQPLQKCRVSKIDIKKKEAIITFAKPQLAVSGQSLVLYDRNICLGGGIIA